MFRAMIVGSAFVWADAAGARARIADAIAATATHTLTLSVPRIPLSSLSRSSLSATGTLTNWPKEALARAIAG